MADFLENINQLDWRIKNADSQIAQYQTQIRRLEEKVQSAETERGNLIKSRRTFGLEQYKGYDFRERLIQRGKESENMDLSAMALDLSKSEKWKEEDLEDDIITFFVGIENEERKNSNQNRVGRFFDFLGKSHLKTLREELRNDN